MAITFDGPNKVVILDTSTVVYGAAEIYSRWKDWLLLSDNAKFLPAFRIVGGDDLGGGAKAPGFIFLRNDIGWRIRKPEATIDVVINGNLVGEDANTGITSPPLGAFSPTLTFNLSSVATSPTIVNVATEAHQCLPEIIHVTIPDTAIIAHASTETIMATPDTPIVAAISVEKLAATTERDITAKVCSLC